MGNFPFKFYFKICFIIKPLEKECFLLIENKKGILMRSMIRCFLLSLFSVVFCMQGASASDALNYVFKSGDAGYHTYRIPAIVATNKGTLLAFAEGRVKNWGDHGNIDIVMKRSTDGGKTWGDLQVVQDDGDHQCGNPAPVVDRKTGRIFLLNNGSTGSEGEVINGKATRECYIQYSDDDGKTWSPRRDITKEARPEGWHWYAMGPCSGIQIQEGKYKGRLVIAANHSDSEKVMRSHCLYSDDSGKTWKVGADAEPGSNESQIAEVAPDLLVQNMRMQANSKGLRGIRTSKDGGVTWTPLEHEAQLPCPRCQASVVRDYYGKGYLYFSNPAAKPLGRKQMTIRGSKDGGKTWTVSEVVFEGPSAYSNLIMMGKDKMGILYEGGMNNIADGIAFKSYALKDLGKNPVAKPMEKK